ncbi:MAG: hypothetical protein ISR65_05140 [Bacteriovoracaceae bacterium]|nr:hypothetical protein [Bacteriovoracaceae bacterium]
MNEQDKIRCFVIADDYRWHLLTDSIDEFYNASLSYLKLMNTSPKENNYYFKNLFLTRDEFNQFLKNIAEFKTEDQLISATKKKQSDQKSIRKSNHLTLVD